MLFLVRHAEARGGRDLKQMLVDLYPKMVHLAGGAVIFMFIAGIIRAFTYKQFEWHNAVESGQVMALMVKHVILFIIFALGVYFWVVVHKKVREIKNGLE
jgi:hypothetical protein